MAKINEEWAEIMRGASKEKLTEIVEKTDEFGRQILNNIDVDQESMKRLIEFRHDRRLFELALIELISK